MFYCNTSAWTLQAKGVGDRSARGEFWVALNQCTEPVILTPTGSVSKLDRYRQRSCARTGVEF